MAEEFPNQKKRQKDFNCSIGFAMTVIGSKWRAIILWHILKVQPIRYGELKKSIPNISHKILSEELKKLEADGLIERIPYATIPPKVEYTPTDRGKSLENILTELCIWGKKYMNGAHKMIFNKMVPELSVSNINISKKFYIDILGFKVEYERKEDKFAFISLDGVQLMLDEGVNGSWSTGITEYPFGRGINFQFFVANIEKIILNLNNNNIKLFKEPFISEYRIDSEIQVFKEILVQDPDGYLLRFSELQQN